MPRTIFGKSRKPAAPYAIYGSNYGADDQWEWRVLKTYKHHAAESADRYSRWFCAVTSRFTHGSADLGDTYRSDVLNHSSLKAATPEWLAAYGYCGLDENLADWSARNNVEVLDL